jgi:hemolysin III
VRRPRVITRGQISWDYDRAEIIADGVVHAIGVCLGLIGVTIVMIAVNIERIEIAPITVYVIGLVTMLALSAAYNMWPVSPAKWVCAASTTPRSIY